MGHSLLIPIYPIPSYPQTSKSKNTSEQPDVKCYELHLNSHLKSYHASLADEIFYRSSEKPSRNLPFPRLFREASPQARTKCITNHNVCTRSLWVKFNQGLLGKKPPWCPSGYGGVVDRRTQTSVDCYTTDTVHAMCI